MKKRLFVLMLVVMTAVSSMAVSADTYTSEGSADVPVTATVGETFVVGLPTSVVLTKQPNGSYSGSFVKQAYGDISSLSTLSVTPNDADNEADGIQLLITSTNGVHNKEVMCTVTDTKTTYDWEELAGSTNLAEQNYNGKATTVSVSRESLTSGEWTGTLTYTISLD